MSGIEIDLRRCEEVVRWLLKLWRLGKSVCAFTSRVLITEKVKMRLVVP